MNIKYILTPLLMILPIISLGVIYKSIDDSGQVVFSDQPRRGGETVDLGTVSSLTWKSNSKITKVSENATTQEAEDDSANNAQAPFVVYTTFSTTAPVNDAFIRSNSGELNVTAEIQPDLQAGDKIRVILDGRPYGELQQSNSFIIEGILRGEHRLMLQIVDSEGSLLKVSKTVSFFMNRTIQVQNKP